ncbi:uncharacterized protein LOC131682189 [Topomyia yanbarensis]|uniref:uncharacterized protein LOC131682189 n=1 Tax=Topomyia yanbarensis TaxID=2498891 RepID=UPI00273B05D5|nr:uncharacterized protein LOC131682189 [Topomyia yanbarensis]
MAGVLFIVNIPSAKFEIILRQKEKEKLAKSSSAELTDEKGDKKDASNENEPFLTPRPQRHLLKDKEDLRRSFFDLTQCKPKDSKPTEGEGGAAIPQLVIPVINCPDGDGLDDPKSPQDDNDAAKQSLAVPFDRTSALRKSWEGFKDILSSARKDKEKDPRAAEAEKFNLDAESTLEDVVKEIIREKKIFNSAWIETNKGKGYQISFTLESGNKCDDLIYLLSSWGVGERFHSTISITSCTLFTEHPEEDETNSELNGSKDGGWTNFLSSVRARLNVAQIVEEVKHDASITFDFISMLGVASILAAFGLIEDSTLFLLASMLISPLMGPIIAGIFGTVIKERSLQLMGVRNETIGILFAITVGFIFGLIVCSLDERYGVGEGITNEMLSRCEVHSLLVGIAIALPSGAAVAIAILGENIGSLVGVAISASLLPPAVNAGVLWALSVLCFLLGAPDERYSAVVKTQIYSENQTIELFALGCMSMCLTFLNILCIYVMGIIFLKIKEVAPIVNKDQKQFWKHDIKIARDYNRTLHSTDGMSMSKQLIHELTTLHNQDPDGRGFGSEMKLSISSRNQHTWSPNHNYHQREHRPTIQELEALYQSLSANTGEGQYHYPTHHAAPSFMKLHPTSHMRPSKPWSPSKEDGQATSPTGRMRQASNPKDIGHHRLHRFTESIRSTSAPLSKILENVPSEGVPGIRSGGVFGEGNSRRNSIMGRPYKYSLKKSNKFIVTPAFDPAAKK